MNVHSRADYEGWLRRQDAEALADRVVEIIDVNLQPRRDGFTRLRLSYDPSRPYEVLSAIMGTSMAVALSERMPKHDMVLFVAAYSPDYAADDEWAAHVEAQQHAGVAP